MSTADRIRECFNIEMARQTFNVSGTTLDVGGETEFFKVSDVRKIEKKINELIAELESES